MGCKKKETSKKGNKREQVRIEEISVKELIKQLEYERVLLPTLQRSFVWTEDKIENLFDSIYKGYPIGIFLIWETSKGNLKNYSINKFIKFVRFYNPYLDNPEFFDILGEGKNGKYYIVFDGQQRITALNIGLRGFMGERGPGRATWVEWKGLFMNLTAKDSDVLFKFFPLFTEDIKKNKDSDWSTCFYGCGKSKDRNCDLRDKDIYNGCREQLKKIVESKEVRKKFLDKIRDHIILGNYNKNKRKDPKREFWVPVWLLYSKIKDRNEENIDEFVRKLLDELFDELKVEPNVFFDKDRKTIEDNMKRFIRKIMDYRIYYYKLTDESTDRLFDIFNRINTGGTPLSYADIIFGFIASAWPEARENFSRLLDDINKEIQGTHRDGFSIDFLIRTVLMLSEEDVAPKISTIIKNKKFVNFVKNNWESLAGDISSVVKFLSFFGITNRDLTSKNSIIPLIYYLNRYKSKNLGVSDNDMFINTNGIIDNVNEEKDEKEIKEVKEVLKYFFASLLNRVFSSHGDEVLRNMKKIIDEEMIEKGQEFNFEIIARSLNEKMSDKNLYIEFCKLEDEKNQIYAGIALKAMWILKKLDEIEKEEGRIDNISGLLSNLEIDHVFPRSKFVKNDDIALKSAKKFVECLTNEKEDVLCREAKNLFKDYYEDNKYEFTEEADIIETILNLSNGKHVSKEDIEKLEEILKNKIQQDWIDRLPNKMLLQGRINRRKKDNSLKDIFKDNKVTKSILDDNLIPDEKYYEKFEDFVFFYLKRYQLLKNAFNKIFG